MDAVRARELEAELFARAGTQASRLRAAVRAGAVGRLGTGSDSLRLRGEMMVILRQGTGFHATFTLRPALCDAVWRI